MGRMRSLQIRLVYSFILIAQISVLLIGFLSLGISLRIFNNREEEYLNRIAREASERLEAYMDSSAPLADLDRALSSFGLLYNVVLRLETPEGDLMAESSALTGGGAGLADVIVFPIVPVAEITLTFNSLRGYSLKVLRFDEYFFHPVSLLVEGMLIAGLSVLLIAVFIGRFIGRRIARPIVDLSAFAAEIRDRHWDEPLPVANSLELDTLTSSLDSMRTELAVSFGTLEEERDIMKRFLQDASHQLRTPVTALNTFLELLDSDIPGIEARRDELVRDSRQQVDKLSRIIADLMELTRIESEQHQRPRELCYLKEICRRAWKGVEAKGRRKNLFLDLSGPSAPVMGDPHLLEMALSNILDNAVKWSPPDRLLAIRTSREGTFCSISVRDRGPGIPEEDLPRVFERFYRSSRRENYDGSGLGLAVVKRIAADHGGEAVASNADGGGARIEIRLPGVGLS